MSDNLYDPHPLQIDSGTFWRCAHGTTGYGSGMVWKGCAPCAAAKGVNLDGESLALTLTQRLRNKGEIEAADEITALQARLEAAERRVAELEKPVTDEEVQSTLVWLYNQLSSSANDQIASLLRRLTRAEDAAQSEARRMREACEKLKSTIRRHIDQ